MSQLRKRALPTSPDHTPLTDKLGTTEQKIKKEIAIMKKCSHPHVVKLIEVIDDDLNEKIYMGTSQSQMLFFPLLSACHLRAPLLSRTNRPQIH